LIKRGKHEDAAREFIEKIVSGPGAWTELPGEMKAELIKNAPTFADEAEGPEAMLFNCDWVSSFSNLNSRQIITMFVDRPLNFPRYDVAVW